MSLAIAHGRSFIVAGPRGSGKTALLGSLILEILPKYRIIIFFGSVAFIAYDNAIFKEKIEKPVLPKAPDEFEKLWLAFYKSQYIPERKNLKYLQRMIPKKYWKWAPELKSFSLWEKAKEKD